ncbi:MAG: hypothetical protein HOM25_21450 [Rhodospirillaceae bacterium]|jgi:hypothetical protein|nr:hypothetical protein [Rhodospirillaceae bacterium]MBT5664727.1 hypothetical protein [Rhodospirillaceae bacterium]
MQALKAVVIVMAVLIVAGLGLLAYGLVTKIGGGSTNDAGADKNNAPQYSAFGTVETALPPGARVVGMAVDDGRIVVRVEAPGGGQSLMVFNVDTGAQLGTIRIRAAP